MLFRSFPDDSVEDIQKQKQLLKDAAAFLVSCQIPSLVSNTGQHQRYKLYQLNWSMLQSVGMAVDIAGE